jgi:hypothetical protein
MRKAERAFSIVFGLFLLGVGIYTASIDAAPLLGRFGVGAVLVLLGGNLLYATYKDTPSWLSRVGPLP